MIYVPSLLGDGAITSSVLILSTKPHITFRLIFVQTLFNTKNINKSSLSYHTYQSNIEKKIIPIIIVPTTCRPPISFLCFLETLLKFLWINHQWPFAKYTRIDVLFAIGTGKIKRFFYAQIERCRMVGVLKHPKFTYQWNYMLVKQGLILQWHYWYRTNLKTPWMHANRYYTLYVYQNKKIWSSI